MLGTIKITGTGVLSVKPDTTVIKLRLGKSYKTYEEALLKSTEVFKIIKDTLNQVGISSESIKTTYFDINLDYDYYQVKNVQNKRIKGYSYSEGVSIEFPKNGKVLGLALDAIAKTNLTPTVEINFKVKDNSKFVEELLKRTIEDATKKAKVLASASNQTLGEITSIDYSFGELRLETTSYELCSTYSCDRSIDLELDPEDITKTENVTITWNISAN